MNGLRTIWRATWTNGWFLCAFRLSAKYSDWLRVPQYHFPFSWNDGTYETVYHFFAEKYIDRQVWGYANQNLGTRVARRRCNGNRQSSSSTFFVSVRIVGSSVCFMWSFQSLGII